MDTKLDDFDGTNLMRSAFPAELDQTAVDRAVAHRKIIKSVAKSMVYRNDPLCTHAGLQVEDLESILFTNAYVLFSKGDVDPPILTSFLKQRSVKIINRYKNKVMHTDETESLVDETPEGIAIAKEEAELKVSLKNQLVEESQDYLNSFLKKNQFPRKYRRVFWMTVLENTVDDFILKGLDRDLFRRVLIIKFSRVRLSLGQDS